jgi:hypothetical protein
VERAGPARRSGARPPIDARCARKLDDIRMDLRLQRRVAMKKSTRSKLTLRAQTIRLLTHEALGGVAGGNTEPAPAGFIMKDTIIIRTSGIVSPSETCR